MQVTRWVSLFGLVALPVRGAAQAPAYDARALGCARFSESVRGQVQSAFGTVRRSETVGRDGVLEVRATQDSAGVSLEAWYDTLAVFREGPEGRSAPDAEGILGGRYRGTLDPDGEYLAAAAPYVPAALREVFDFTRVPLHFFPPLPRAPLAAGREWSDGAGLTIWRLADSALVGRYRWVRRENWEEGVSVGDSTLVVHRTEVENGALQWRAGEGPLGWSATVLAGMELTGGAGRTEVTQQVTVRRLAGPCATP